jgi:nicotinamide-nucleotide amidase
VQPAPPRVGDAPAAPDTGPVSGNVPSDSELSVLAVRVGASLLKRDMKVATAESCTGGYLAKLITDIAGSSQWFNCGFIAYSNEAKQRQLGVTAATLAQHGAVSEQTAIEMAVGALVVGEARRAVSITGVAGPDGGTASHPVGLVWFSRAQRLENGSVGAIAVQRRFPGDRDAVRRQAAACALGLLLDP